MELCIYYNYFKFYFPDEFIAFCINHLFGQFRRLYNLNVYWREFFQGNRLLIFHSKRENPFNWINVTTVLSWKNLAIEKYIRFPTKVPLSSKRAFKPFTSRLLKTTYPNEFLDSSTILLYRVSHFSFRSWILHNLLSDNQNVLIWQAPTCLPNLNVSIGG